VRGLQKAENLHLRIAILTQQISNYHAARFQAARQVFDEVTVLSVLNSADFPEFLVNAENGAGIYRICDGDADYSSAIADGSLWSRISQALYASSPDIVAVAGWAFPESSAAIAWARKHGRGVVMMSDSQVHDAARVNGREWIKYRVVSACDAALVAAGSHKSYIERLGLSSKAVFLGYDVVDSDHFQRGAKAARTKAKEYRAAEGLPRRYLLASGRFIPKKNYSRLVAAFAGALEIADKGHDLVILGDGPERQVIEDAIVEHGMEKRIHLPGFRDYESLPAWYGLSDGFIHVSVSEQWGLVVNEAAAARLPLVVSSPCGSAKVLVRSGENGWLVDPEDVSAMASAIAKMMNLTPELRQEMGEASQLIVADWGPRRFAEGLSSAANIAFRRKRRDLAFWDRLLFRMLARIRARKVT
jgi:1,2-diacylglycerol 3-alpha-glucosyltransferase